MKLLKNETIYTIEFHWKELHELKYILNDYLISNYGKEETEDYKKRLHYYNEIGKIIDD